MVLCQVHHTSYIRCVPWDWPEGSSLHVHRTVHYTHPHYKLHAWMHALHSESTQKLFLRLFMCNAVAVIGVAKCFLFSVIYNISLPGNYSLLLERSVIIMSV